MSEPTNADLLAAIERQGDELRREIDDGRTEVMAEIAGLDGKVTGLLGDLRGRVDRVSRRLADLSSTVDGVVGSIAELWRHTEHPPGGDHPRSA